MSDNIDVDASPIIYGGELKKLGDNFLKLTAEVASGRQTKGRISWLYGDGNCPGL